MQTISIKTSISTRKTRKFAKVGNPTHMVLVSSTGAVNVHTRVKRANGFAVMFNRFIKG